MAILSDDQFWYTKYQSIHTNQFSIKSISSLIDWEMKTIEQWLSLVEVIIWWNLTWILDTEWCSVNMFGISIGALNSKKKDQMWTYLKLTLLITIEQL